MNQVTQSIVVNLLAAVLVVSNQAHASGPRWAAPVVVPINKVDKSLDGKWVTIKGTVEEASGFSKGFKFVVKDETGAISLTYFDSSYDALSKDAQKQLNVGATVQVNGRVSEYNGKFDLIPSKPRDTVIISPTLRVLPLRELGGLNRGDYGAVVHVQGEFYREQSFDGGVDWIIADKTGAQKVRLYDSVLKRIMQRDLAKPESKVLIDVVGRVKLSKKEGLRIDVALPVDVVITSSQQLTVTTQPKSDR